MISFLVLQVDTEFVRHRGLESVRMESDHRRVGKCPTPGSEMSDIFFWELEDDIFYWNSPKNDIKS